LRKPGPLAPPSLDGLPRATTQSMAALSTTPSGRPVADPTPSREVTQPFIIHPGDGATQVAPWPPRPVANSALTAPNKTHMPAPAPPPAPPPLAPAPPPPAPPKLASAAAVVDTEPMRTIPGLQAPPPFVPSAARAADTQPMTAMPTMAPPSPAPRATMPTVPPIPLAGPVATVAPGAATVVRHIDAEATAIVPPPSLPPPPPPLAPPPAPLAFESTVVAAPKPAPAVTLEPTLVAPPPDPVVAPVPAPAAPAPRAAPTPKHDVTEALPVMAAPAPAVPAPAPAAPRFAPALPTPAQVVTDVMPTIKVPAPAPNAPAGAAPAPAPPSSGTADGARPGWAAPAKAAVPAAVKPRRLEYASWWRQWCAAIVDGVGSAAVVLGLVRLVMLALSIKPSTQGLIDALHSNVLQLVPVAAAWPIGVFVWHLLALAFGSTVGQRLLGLRLVDSHGHRAGPIRLVIRALVAGATSVFLIGPAWALLLDGRRRGFGDIVARTAAIHR
jgi:uncharacterized RDD family membrane protein YckC